ncbi:MAG: Fic family protein, partial [Gammaproteobacteria bacterium]
GLTRFRQNADGALVWIEQFASAAARSAALARKYLGEVQALQSKWREQLETTSAPRADAAAWAVIEVLPAHPILAAPIAAAATGRSRAPVYEAIAQLEAAGVLIPLSQSKRNRSWEAAGLLDLVAGLEAGRMPD